LKLKIINKVTQIFYNNVLEKVTQIFL